MVPTMIFGVIHTLVVVIISFGLGFLTTGFQPTYQVVKKPAAIEAKAIYLTGYTAGSKERREALIDLVDSTELNAVVIDIKDASGRIFFDTGLALANEVGSEQIRIPDLEGLVDRIKEKGIYTIARIVVFQDPYLAQAMPQIALKSTADGLNIGQRYEDAAKYFDYIAPMVYPSHYPPGFEGFDNPAAHPYEIVYRSLIRAEKLLDQPKARLRPWLQDFDLGAVYTPEMITLQKQATYDSGGFGWMLWNASNRYTVGGLLSSDDAGQVAGVDNQPSL